MRKNSILNNNSSTKSTKQIVSFIELATRIGVDFALIRNKNKTNLHLSFKDEEFNSCEKNLKEMENSISSEKTKTTEKNISGVIKKVDVFRRVKQPSLSIFDRNYSISDVKKLISLRQKDKNDNEKEISAQSELLGVENFIEYGLSNKEVLLLLKIAIDNIGHKKNIIDLFRYVQKNYYLPFNIIKKGGYCNNYFKFVYVYRTFYGSDLETRFLNGEKVDMDFSPSTLYKRLQRRESRNKELFPL